MPSLRKPDGALAGNWWQPADDGERIDCLLCPRRCSLKPGDRGFCFVRENRDGEMVLTTYGKSTGFCIDPIEKKPLNHFYPGTPVLSFGTAGCNLGCKFCQNWDISKSREVQRLSAVAEPADIAAAAKQHGCLSVAYTYNDPVIWAEYAIDTARACREAGLKNVAVTAGYISPPAREDFFRFMDAANVDLKAFSEDFYHKVTYSHLEPVLDTLLYLKHSTDVWFELTNLLIPEANDNPDELRKMCGWIVESIGPDVPIHFTAFHPDFRMMDRPRTDPETLMQARDIALQAGIRYAYVGNVHDVHRQSTRCHQCGQLLIERDWYQLGAYNIDVAGRCTACQTAIPGRFGIQRGEWGAKRLPIQIRPAPREPSRPAVPSELPENSSTTNLPVISAEEIPVSSANHETSAPNPAPGNPPASPASPMMDLNVLKAEQKQALLQSTANWLTQAVFEESLRAPEASLGDLAQSVVMGAFVTVKRGPVLRGCCGVLGKPMQVGAALAAAAAKTAAEDQRMAALSPSELAHLNMDITLLGPFQKIEAEGADRASTVQIGQHGLMIQRGDRNGLLLPSVAVERKWTPVQFLQGVCSKAGLPIGAWQSSDATVCTFDGQSLSAELAPLLALNLPQSIECPITVEQLSEYAKLAGQNIVAMVTGGTPSYVIPHLPDATVHALVLSMQWGAGNPSEPASAADLQQGNALQVSFRPGVPLQSTLFQMCQRAAAMFHQQRFSGQLQIGLSLGFDPAMHGYGLEADLEGVNTAERGIVISDHRHCGFAFHPEQSVVELQKTLRSRLPISSRDAAVHSLQVISTMPHVISISAPTPVAGSGTRPPAVAGKFYPAEDAARRAMVGSLFKGVEPTDSDTAPLAIMVPHAGIKYSGKVAARAWSSAGNLEDRPLIVISPKHTAQGCNWSVCPFGSWRVSGTCSIAGDASLAKQIAQAVTPVELDVAAHEKEHGIEVQLPLLEHLAPSAKVVGMAFNGGSWGDIQAAAAEFAELLKTLPEQPLLVISSDMNHYAPDDENRRRDRLALDAVAAGDPQGLIQTCREHDISMCGVVPATFVMETLKQLGQPFQVHELGYATSAEVSGDKTQVVGYAGLRFDSAAAGSA